MNINDAQDQAKFKATFIDFLNSISLKVPQSRYNEFELYKLVCQRGGFQAVCNRNEWGEIAAEIDAKSQEAILKLFYFKFLYPYEQKYYYGCENDDQQPNLLMGNPRKLQKMDPSIKQRQEQREQGNTTLESELTKYFEEEEKSREHFYLNKNKLTQSKTEIKKITIGLESYMDRKDINYSLNMLLLYSVNIHFPFLFETHEKIFTSLSSFTHSIYPANNEEEKEYLRTVTLIIRNLTMNPINLKFMLGSQLFQLLVTIFNTGYDIECSKNIIDIMSGLVKVGWDCFTILQGLDQAILNHRVEDAEMYIELLRGLVDERDENLVKAVSEKLNVLIRVLLSGELSVEVKEQVMEILSFVADATTESRMILSKNSQLIAIVIGILSHMKNQEKLIQFTALVLSNISSAPGAKNLLQLYETELVTIGFSDDSLAGIVSNILADLATK